MPILDLNVKKATIARAGADPTGIQVGNVKGTLGAALSSLGIAPAAVGPAVAAGNGRLSFLVSGGGLATANFCRHARALAASRSPRVRRRPPPS